MKGRGGGVVRLRTRRLTHACTDTDRARGTNMLREGAGAGTGGKRGEQTLCSMIKSCSSLVGQGTRTLDDDLASPQNHIDGTM
jgi:hypothetical protein